MLVNAQLSASLRSETVTPRFEAHARTNFCHSQALCTKAYTFCSQDIYSYSISNKSEEVLTNPFNHMHCCPSNTNVSVSSSLFHIFSRRYGHKKMGTRLRTKLHRKTADKRQLLWYDSYRLKSSTHADIYTYIPCWS